MTGVAGAFLMLGGMAAITVIITTLDYLAGRRDENLHCGGGRGGISWRALTNMARRAPHCKGTSTPTPSPRESWLARASRRAAPLDKLGAP
jgi:hypothetical protein